MNNKIFIPAIIAAIVVGVTGVLYLDTVNNDTVNMTQKELVETKSYKTGLLPPPESIFNTIVNISGTADAVENTQGIFSHLLNMWSKVIVVCMHT